jgi:hypothetical protein
MLETGPGITFHLILTMTLSTDYYHHLLFSWETAEAQKLKGGSGFQGYVFVSI